MYRLFDFLRHRARLRLWNHDRAWGRRGEDVAHRFLRRNGYTIVARNYRTRSASAEVDIIAWDGDALAFIEVKARQSDDFGAPDRAVDAEKRRKIVLGARDYTRRARIDWAKARFDVVSIVWDDPPQIRLDKDAFEKLAGKIPAFRS